MLILTRKPGESLYIGDNVKVTIVEIKGHQIRVGIDAPTELRIYREEIYLQILEENKRAAEVGQATDSGLENLTSAWAGRKHLAPAPGRKSISSLGARPAPAAAADSSKQPEVLVKRKKKKEFEDDE